MRLMFVSFARFLSRGRHAKIFFHEREGEDPSCFTRHPLDLIAVLCCDGASFNDGELALAAAEASAEASDADVGLILLHPWEK